MRDSVPRNSLHDHPTRLGHLGLCQVCQAPATMIRLSKNSKNNSLPLRDHIGYLPSSLEICHFPPVSGKARTYTRKFPDSREACVNHIPSGEKEGRRSSAGVCRKKSGQLCPNCLYSAFPTLNESNTGSAFAQRVGPR
jgi:hypothetical protein